MRAEHKVSLLVRGALFLLGLLAQLNAAYADVQHIYDSAGRLVQTIAPDGTSAVYQYDPAGNISAIQRLTAGQLSLVGFSPTAGGPGTQVTLQGTGYSATPTSNAVTFNGSAATVLSAAANKLVVEVPSGATTGPISVTVGANTATSSQNFTVQAGPTITGFSPSVVQVGASVTVTGTNLGLASSLGQVTVGTAAAQVTSVSPTSLAFVASRSGLIRVRTPFGVATSSAPLIVVPSAISTANVVASTQLPPGSGSQNLTVSQSGKVGALTIEAGQGQYLSVHVSSVTTTPANTNLGYQIVSPTSTVVGSGTLSASNRSIHLPQAVEGTYVVAFSASGTTFQLSAEVEINPTVSANAVAFNVTTSVAGQSRRVVLPALIGQDIGVGIASCSHSSSYSIVRPDGVALSGGGTTCEPSYPSGGTNISARDIPQNGAYTILSVPSGATTLSLSMTVSEAIGSTLTSGTPLNLNLAARGQFAYLSFTATAGQNALIALDTLVTAPVANQNVRFEVFAPNGTSVANNTTTGTRYFNLTNLVAGTYKVAAFPWYGLTSTSRVTFGASATGTLPTDGTVTSVATTLAGQNLHYTFTATAGQTLGVGLANCTVSTSFTVFRPNGSQLGSNTCSPSNPGAGDHVWSQSLPETGTYKVTLAPTGYTTFGVDVTVSQAVSGSLSIGTPQTVTLPVRAQFGYYSFTATAGQTLALRVDSVSTTPASNQNVAVHVYGPTGAVVASSSATGSRTYNLTNLAAGTHKVAVVPWYGLTGSARLTLANGVSGTLPTDGTATSIATTLAGQNAYYEFTATAGQTLGVGLANCTATINFAVIRPDGGQLGSRTCYTSNPGAGEHLWWQSLPQTGTYRITLSPADYTTFGVDVTVSQAVSGTLSIGTPQTVTLPVRAQFGYYSFTATAGQTLALRVDSVSTTPANNNVAVEIYGPTGSLVTSSSATGSRTYNLTNLAAGTHKVAVVPWYGVPGGAQLTLADGVSGTLPTDGTATSVATTLAGQNAYYTFTATAGQTLGVGLANCTTSINFAVIRPDGGQLGSRTCYTSNPGAGEHLWWQSLPQTGTYKLTLSPSGYTTLGVDVTVSQALTGTLSVGTPQTVTLPVRAQFGYYSFTATAGQTLALKVDSVSTTPANNSVSVEIYGPTGSLVTSSSATGSRTYNLTNLAAGTHKVVIAPWYGLTGSVQLALADGVAGTVPMDGTVTNVATTLAGQNAYYTFTATAGQSLAVGMSGCTATVGITITRPDNGSLASQTCYASNPGSGENIWVRSLPQTGTYKITLTPSGYTTIGLALTVNQAAAYPLTIGTTQSVTLPSGRWGLATFTATAGQSAAVTLNSVSTTPTGQNVIVEIYNPSGSVVASSYATGTRTYNLSNLSAGTYQIAIVPFYGVAATAGITVN